VGLALLFFRFTRFPPHTLVKMPLFVARFPSPNEKKPKIFSLSPGDAFNGRKKAPQNRLFCGAFLQFGCFHQFSSYA
jgi:hypothetical protein